MASYLQYLAGAPASSRVAPASSCSKALPLCTVLTRSADSPNRRRGDIPQSWTCDARVNDANGGASGAAANGLADSAEHVAMALSAKPAMYL
eukprot:CAMPEP_0174733278 /NCGR_PEP_ID=MMETSP1094-20130205/60988_1 /TAXON_ID=156173 /ORGANISM="Chrysochromulina brevifilum, Strain UTEX LB 985" /LENGTH=91 /DNA_ID=CAMNT_0015935915 /DNA_START=704 /DNA_END=979 /DNA_ORIENTATION=+